MRTVLRVLLSAILFQSGCGNDPAASSEPLCGHFQLRVWLEIVERDKDAKTVQTYTTEPFQCDFWVSPGQETRSISQLPDGRRALLHSDRLTLSRTEARAYAWGYNLNFQLQGPGVHLSAWPYERRGYAEPDSEKPTIFPVDQPVDLAIQGAVGYPKEDGSFQSRVRHSLTFVEAARLSELMEKKDSLIVNLPENLREKLATK